MAINSCIRYVLYNTHYRVFMGHRIYSYRTGSINDWFLELNKARMYARKCDAVRQLNRFKDEHIRILPVKCEFVPETSSL